MSQLPLSIGMDADGHVRIFVGPVSWDEDEQSYVPEWLNGGDGVVPIETKAIPLVPGELRRLTIGELIERRAVDSQAGV